MLQPHLSYDSRDTPTEEEGGEERTLERLGQGGLERVVHSEVQTTVDNDTDDRGQETTVETGNTISGEGLLVTVRMTPKSAAVGVVAVST